VLFCIAREPEWIALLQKQFSDRLTLVPIVGENAAVARLDEASAAPVVLLDASLDPCCLTAIVRKLDTITPQPTVLVLGNSVAANRSLIGNLTRSACVRCLPESAPSGLLEQLVEDGIERHRLQLMEQTLTRELENAQTRLAELSHFAADYGVDGTAAILRLYHLVSSLNGLTRPEEVASFVVSAAAGLVCSRRVSLLVPDTNQEYLTVAASVGLEPDLAARTRIPVGAPLCGEVFAKSQTVIIPDLCIPSRWSKREDRELLPRSPLISLVLSGPDRPLAVLNVSEPINADAYTDEALTGLQTLAEITAIALANYARSQERDEARDAIMLALAKLAESRDPETGKHLERVQDYCRLLAEALAKLPKYRDTITPGFIETLVRSSPLHDIGKVGIPDHILLKPGALSPEEFAIMKRHSSIGGDTIKALFKQGRQRDFLEMAMEIAYHHHEKFDGSGYPDGLRSTDIPLAARILALADVYDALTTVRVYKKARPHNEAREIVLKGRGSHFDPDVVDAFCRHEQEFEKLALELADTVGGKTPSVAGVCAADVAG
jgi:HD-GYP domain-containing protein (c-di-GMP phosphodiesterase class II)